MVVEICPRCQQRYVKDGDIDFVHECNSGQAVLDNEDVLIVGDWVDYTGSGVEQNVNMQGIGNELMGTRAGIEGTEKEDVTKRGNSADVTRQRQHLEFIDGK